MSDLEKRVAQLEDEVTQLKAEMAKLQTPKETFRIPMGRVEKTTVARQPLPEKPQREAKPRKSFEEQLPMLLPKVFMLVFVLGVIWGLKLMSNYGYLNNEVKILLCYVLSIGLGIFALWLNKTGKAVRNVRLSLFGGSFIIGVLTTAAAVIIYDIFTLNIALLIAIAYIVYGVWLSYWQANEGLTSFVMLVSLLLPYLLDYMAFNALYIINFIILLYIIMMLVIVKHQQKVSLYTTTIFSGLSVLILYLKATESNLLYGYGAVLLLFVFFAGWLFIHKQKYFTVHIGLVYSLGSTGILLLNTINVSSLERIFLFLSVAVVTLLIYVIRRKDGATADVFATLTLLAVANILMNTTMMTEIKHMLLLGVAAMGVIIGMRHHASLMKLTNSVMFALVTLFIFIIYDVHKPLDMLVYILPSIFLVLIIIVNERTAIIGRYAQFLAKWRWVEILRCVATLLVIQFFAEIDVVYFANQGYIALCVLAIIALLALTLPQNITKEIWPYFMLVVLALGLGKLWMIEDSIQHFMLAFTTHAAYLIVLAYMTSNVYRKKLLYKRFAKFTTANYEAIVLALSAITVITLWSLSYSAFGVAVISLTVHSLATTVLLFIWSVLLLIIGRKQQQKLWQRTGYAVIFIALAKLIFYDLSMLNLAVRTVFFMLVGALGLVLSNKLLKREHEKNR